MTNFANSRTASDASQHRTGTNHKDIRNYNERLIIDTIRQIGEVSKADLAKITKLSAQTATIIVNKLLDDDLLRKMESVKGRGHAEMSHCLAPPSKLEVYAPRPSAPIQSSHRNRSSSSSNSNGTAVNNSEIPLLTSKLADSAKGF